MNSSAIKRHGGKAYLAPQIRALQPKHTRYCETHFGTGAVMFTASGEGVAEYANDIDGELTNFWRVLADQQTYGDFVRIVQAVPFSAVEFKAACGNGEFTPSNIARAVAFFIRNRQSRQGLGKDFATPTSRLRRGMNEQVSAWLSAVDSLPEFHARLRRVEIRNSDAVDFISELDSPETFFYCDPPYLQLDSDGSPIRRKGANEYGKHEMTLEGHADLLLQLGSIKGKFILSGYPSKFYDQRAKDFGWHHVDYIRPNQASSAKKKERKVERLWMNYKPKTT